MVVLVEVAQAQIRGEATLGASCNVIVRQLKPQDSQAVVSAEKTTISVFDWCGNDGAPRKSKRTSILVRNTRDIRDSFMAAFWLHS